MPTYHALYPTDPTALVVTSIGKWCAAPCSLRLATRSFSRDQIPLGQIVKFGPILVGILTVAIS
jgi:hypothetical protein